MSNGWDGQGCYSEIEKAGNTAWLMFTIIIIVNLLGINLVSKYIAQKKSLTTICFKPHFLHYGTWWYLQCNNTEPPPLLPIPPTEASKSWDPQGNIYVNSYFSFLCPKQNNFVFHMLITHSYQCLHFGSHLFQIISSTLVSSLHIALNCMSLDFQLLKNSQTY